MQCVELRAIYYIDSPFDSLKAAMRVCGESFACVGVKKTSGNRFQSLTALTGYVFNETCKDYYLRDKTGGVTFSNQPNQMEAKILFAIYPNGECPSSFFVDGSLCRGRSIVTVSF
uniref:Uncharacterized protein n=1 Tax=Panagrolaimus sp. PS1159 TaxID=55785 RepID=A0AC35GMY2_9BILA